MFPTYGFLHMWKFQVRNTADYTAKASSTLAVASSLKIPFSDFVLLIRKSNDVLWNHNWNNLSSNSCYANRYKIIVSISSRHPSFYYKGFGRTLIVKLCRV